MATEEDKQSARERLAKLTGRYEKAESQLEEVRKEVADEISAILMARTLGPSEVTKLSPFERQHVGRIAKAAGVPPLREATVVSRAKAAKELSPAAKPRQQVAQAVRRPVPTISPRVAALPYERVRELAERAGERYPDWVEEIRQEYPHLRGPDFDLVIVELGHQKGFKIPELAEPSTADPVDRPVTEEEAAEFAARARSMATEMQLKKLDQVAEMAADGSKDFAVMHTALDMELLKHDEVYGTNEETTA
jgi:hypothetical protein